MNERPERDVDPDDPFWREVARSMREAIVKRRGRVDYWKWAIDETRAEMEAARVLRDYLIHSGEPLTGVLTLVRPDPPDVLLATCAGRRVGIEVTELVDEDAMRDFAKQKKGGRILDDWVEWPTPKIVKGLCDAIAKKDKKLSHAKDTCDEHLVAIVTDELAIDEAAARLAIASCSPEVTVIARAFLLLSYHPRADSAVYPDGCAVIPITLRTRKTNSVVAK